MITKSVKNTLIALLIVSGAFLTGCQKVQDSAKELRSAIDQTVSNTTEKAADLKGKFDETANSVKNTLDQTKEAIDTKVDQIENANTKLTEAQKAITDAQEAVEQVTK